MPEKKKMNKVFIIAEAGVNHNGSVKLAKEMIRAAAEAGADAVKFQTFNAEKVVSKHAPKAAYQKRSTSKNESQLEMLKKLELDTNEHMELLGYCKKRGVSFLSTPFDHDSIDLLDKLGLEIFKIPSGEITNLPYLRKIGNLRKHIILSTGMADLNEIRNALKILISSGTPKKMITILHCNTEYPTPMEDVNLLAMLAIKEAFNVKVGYSDHTLGIEVPIAAVALGATVVEKHFTLNKKMKGPDHKASLAPAELAAMVRAIRNIEKALGARLKRPSNSEKKNRNIVRKSLVAAIPIKNGERFTAKNVTMKRPGNGLSPMDWDRVIGRVANRDINEDGLITL